MLINMTRRKPQKQRKGGAPKDNINAKRKPLAWIKYDLDSNDNLDLFIQDVIKATWMNKLDTRSASALNGSIRLLMEKRGLIQKSALNITQSQNSQNEEEIISEFIMDLPAELKNGLMVHVQKQNKHRQDSQDSQTV